MKSSEIRQKFLQFFKDRGHTIIPSSSLIPDDPSVLLTTAGMQQFKKYFTGEINAEKDFGSFNTTSIQKSFRTSDIDEVGDETHLTFFEMLGNFSFGGYWKKEAIQYGYDFITKEMGLQIDFVTVFEGESLDSARDKSGVPPDLESEKIWRSLNPKITVKKFGRKDNFWGPTGSEGPCGPTTEIYVNGVEIWNIVFNEYYAESLGVDPVRSPSPEGDGRRLRRLTSNGVDTGMGLERLAMVSQNVKTIFDTDLFAPLLAMLPNTLDTKTKRIFADHARGSTFLLADHVRPSNKEAGYVLRRVLRRIFFYMHSQGLQADTLEEMMKRVIQEYRNFYPELNKQKNEILEAQWVEYEQFAKTLKNGVKELEKMEKIDALGAFRLYESFGLPYEIIKEVGGKKAQTLTREAFDEAFKKHQEISRAGKEAKFGGHGIYLKTGEVTVRDKSELEKVTRLHTATHLMHAALREILGSEVKQNGSDITVERTRFDFTFPRKLTDEELKKVEHRVNEIIREDLPMQHKEMLKTDAEKTGALFFFKEKYPEQVNVYYVGKTIEDAFSKEFCGGPHVTHTAEIGKFKIVKQEAVGAGMRRIRGIIEP